MSQLKRVNLKNIQVNPEAQFQKNKQPNQKMEKEMATHPRQSWTQLKRPSMHALEKEMATHSSILAWRIPGTEEPGGLPSMGSHSIGHD